jgi:hypothetical protein
MAPIFVIAGLQTTVITKCADVFMICVRIEFHMYFINYHHKIES